MMKAMLFAATMIAAPALAQDQTGTSITTQPATSKSADNSLQAPGPTAKDAMQPNDTSITTRSGVSQGSNTADGAGGATGGGDTVSASAAPAGKASYPWCSRTVTDGCKQRVDPK